MGGFAGPRYLLPCCGRISPVPPVAAVCFDCAMATSSPNDPIAVRYRQRMAAYAAERAAATAPEATDGE